MKKYNRTYMIILALLCLFLCSETVQAKEPEHKLVRVGYYPVATYQEVNEDGTYSGFSYDYFMQMQKYTRWKYDFVQASYAECMQMLLDGEIDIMAGVGKTPEREEEMLFSSYAVTNSQNKLYTRDDNYALFYESYDTFDGCKIAMMQGMLTKEVEDYSKTHNFKSEIIQYNSMDDMLSDLKAGKVDMICSSAVPNNEETKIVGRMDKQPLYYAISKHSPDIAAELNDAMHKITDNNPDFYTQMSEKYMISGANATATFTREEMEYIQSKQKVYVIMNPSWAPISWYDDKSGEYKGIFVDVLERIKEYSGLEFVLCTEDEFNEKAAKNPEIVDNVIAILADDNSWAVKQNVMMTNHVVDSSVVMVTKRGRYQSDFAEDTIIAMPRRFYIGYVMQDMLADKKVVEYDTVEECLAAVNSGRADATYVNELVATYYLSMMEFNNLYATANTGYYENLAFAVNKDSAAPLLSIFDKSLLCLGSTEMNQIVIQNSISEERFSLEGLYYTNPQLVMGLVVFTCILLAGIIFVIYSVFKKRKIAEDELKKEAETNSARTEFFMMISHELRTPLNAIVGYLNLVADEHQRNNWDMEYVKRSQNAAKQLTDIAEDMLDYTKIASNSVELKEELFDLKEMIQYVDQNISIRAVQKDLRYRVSLHNLEHEYVLGDQLRVSQVFQNIMSNGVKFTEAGGMVDVDITEELLEDNKIKLILTCKDTGKGMTEEFVERICAPFDQSDSSYSRTHGGLGLGLYLTQYFVERMGGSLKVVSKLNEGSTFTVTIVLKRPNSEEILKRHIDCSHVRAVIAGTNAEDNSNLKDLLGRLKIKSDIITDKAKLVKRIQSRRGSEFAYSLCILDETMLQEKTGIEAEIASLNEAPVLFAITSNSTLIDALSNDSAVERVLYKPLFQSVLFDAVMDTFGEYKQEQALEAVENFGGIEVMIVEDNMVNADILTRILKKANVNATTCENGQVAVDTFEQAEDNRYQMIFMDIQMPIMNGYEATARIRQSKKAQGKTIPIVAVSANAFAEDIAKSMEAGMNEHLCKPVNGKKLYEAIRKYTVRNQSEKIG